MGGGGGTSGIVFQARYVAWRLGQILGPSVRL